VREALQPSLGGRYPRLVCSGGTGGFHFSMPREPVEALHESSQATMWAQRQRTETEHRAGNDRLLDHAPVPGRLEGRLAKHTTYEINRKVFASSLAPTPLPPRSNSAHWLCQVNSMTGKYNPITHLPLSSSEVKHRQVEVQRFWAKQESDRVPAAGATQPPFPVDHRQFLMGTTMPQPRELAGGRERGHLLSS